MHRALAFLTLPFALALPAAQAQTPAPAQTAAAAVPSASEELARLFNEDQADRTPPAGKSIDWSVVAPRDKARLARIKELSGTGRLETGADYFHAALILQHSAEADDYLLAHELCIVAIGKGEEKAKWLSAATLDRFLMRIGRPQHFGTQFHKENPAQPDDPWRLYNVDPAMTDALRAAFNVPPLAAAREREAQMNQKPAAAP